MGRHIPPTRESVIWLVERDGPKAIFGPRWRKSKAETLRLLRAMSDQEYMRQCGCDNADEQGNCMGHEAQA